MAVPGAERTITDALTRWPGVSAHPHRFGGTEYRFGEKREIGHIHGDHLVDIPFPTKVRDDIIAAGRAEPHHILPESGWISFYLRAPDDVSRALELLQLSYDLAVKQRGQASNAA